MANFFKKIVGKLSKDNSVFGIDVGSSAIKIVQLKSKGGKISLETYGSIALGPYANSDIGKSLNLTSKDLAKATRDISAEAEVTATNVGFAIPFRSSLISLITLPDLPDDKLAQTIPYEARKYIPVQMDEVSIDWSLVPDTLFEQDEENKRRHALLIAIHNRDLKKYRDLITEMKYNVKFFEIEIFSTIRSVLGKNRVPTIIVDIGARTTKFYVIEHGIVLKSYFINQGGQTITHSIENVLGIPFKEAEILKRKSGIQIEHEEARKSVMFIFDSIFSEINRAISDFQTKYKKDIGRLVFTGGGAVTSGLLDYSRGKLNIEPELADPFNKTEHPDFLKETLRVVGAEFSVALGAAIRALE